MHRKYRAALLAAASTLVHAKAQAQDTQTDVFGLGQIEQVRVTASAMSQSISESTVSAEDIFKFNATTVDRALDLTTGTAAGTTGGPRNEKLFFIRGFDRFQSALFVDGIRVYLPADNRLDVGFFNTATLAQIQVDKGYVSVLSGPGAMGGALNLITRKPTQPFEYEARAGIALAGNGDYNGYNTSGLVGGNDGKVYWQASGAVTKNRPFPPARQFHADRDRKRRNPRPLRCTQLQLGLQGRRNAQRHR